MDGRPDRRGRVLLHAYNFNDVLVLEQILSFEDYYEEPHSIIDEDDFRAAKVVRRLTGSIYDLDGKRTQEFGNSHGEFAAYVRGRAVHGDGTVIED